MKNVNFKKIASIVLAVTLVLSIIAPVPAAAAELKQAAEAELSVEQKLEEHMPLCDGDVLVISGDFLCTDEKLAVTIPDAFLLIQGDRSIQESADSNAMQALLPLLTGSGE